MESHSGHPASENGMATMKATSVKVPAMEMSNSPVTMRMPTPMAAMAVTGICCDSTARLPVVAKANADGAAKLHARQTASSSP